MPNPMLLTLFIAVKATVACTLAVQPSAPVPPTQIMALSS
ncbi:hypothetical protein VIA_003178 [Vibrio orientalis CIP 102891 = ATCC 33934]|uniref:Uncharacterized protein n=1 Tax=Vibrio orientalis CIP 102891 = ATCC 33934 TaxID=675816 RepID=A0ABP2GWP2_VIBOR|nr:hypothetical protein VIA_003178 [Vibrio orientalis CIP 102891 = ATCC 33934]